MITHIDNMNYLAADSNANFLQPASIENDKFHFTSVVHKIQKRGYIDKKITFLQKQRESLNSLLGRQEVSSQLVGQGEF